MKIPKRHIFFLEDVLFIGLTPSAEYYTKRINTSLSDKNLLGKEFPKQNTEL